MNHLAIVLSLLAGTSFAFAQTSSTGSASGQTSTNSSSVQGAAGTNVGGTVHTNQGNQFGNSATGAPTAGMERTGQPATNNPAGDSAASKNSTTTIGNTAGGSPTNQQGGSPGTSSRQ
jgi:hypothetical protein